MTLVGFILTYPQGPSTPAARSAIDLSLLVFDNFGTSFAVANSAARIMRDLCTKIDILTEQAQARQSAADTILSATNYGGQGDQALMDNGFSMANINNSMDVDLGLYDLDGSSQQLFDMALTVDFWADFDMLWPNTEPAHEQWTLAQ
ncbi:hypothetical protein B0J14DRAFT_600517 [Halenospora varia]|nr:hypothetical protein B0J14DRAFT_600517 [Halenospora varia]